MPCADRSTSASRTGVAETPYCSAISLTVNSCPGCSRPASTSSRRASAICCRRVLRVTAPVPLVPGMGRASPRRVRLACTSLSTSTPPYAFGLRLLTRVAVRGLSGRGRLPGVLVRDAQRRVERREPLLQLGLAHVARGHDVGAVHVDEG